MDFFFQVSLDWIGMCSACDVNYSRIDFSGQVLWLFCVTCINSNQNNIITPLFGYLVHVQLCRLSTFRKYRSVRYCIRGRSIKCIVKRRTLETRRDWSYWYNVYFTIATDCMYVGKNIGLKSIDLRSHKYRDLSNSMTVELGPAV